MIKGLLLAVVIIVLTACQSKQVLYQQQLFSFGTLIDISIMTDDSLSAQKAIAEISSEFDKLHRQWHPWQQGELGQLNKILTRKKKTAASTSIIKLIKDSQRLSGLSNGLFNPAIGQLIKLWQFDQLENKQYQFKLPDAEQINTLLKQQPKMTDIIITGSDLKSNNSAVSLDFGAFAKGVAIEKMIAILKKYNINNAIINAGGDLKVIGTKHDRAWRIGIKNPLHTQDSSKKAIIAAINLNDGEALFTSGNYERFFNFQGKHYHHIIDPRTGYPARGTRSVTILTKDAALADAASTALFIAGPEHWPEIAKKMKLDTIMLIAEDNSIYLSPAMAKRIELLTDIQPIINIKCCEIE